MSPHVAKLTGTWAVVFIDESGRCRFLNCRSHDHAIRRANRIARRRARETS